MSEYKIADGHDEAGSLVTINALSTGLFLDFAGGMETEWHESASRILAGDRKTYVLVGLPFVSWIFFKLTPTEMKYLKDNFGPEVTIRTLDKSTDSFKNFNATILFPDLSTQEYDIGDWYKFKIDFIDLVELV